MPLYEYRCKAGHGTDSLQLFDTRPSWIKCQVCGKRARAAIAPAVGIVKNPAVPRVRAHK